MNLIKAVTEPIERVGAEAVSNRFILVFLADNWGNPIGDARVNTRTGKMTIEISDPDVVEALVNTDRYLLGLTIEEVKRRRPDAGGKRPDVEDPLQERRERRQAARSEGETEGFE
jgi:hypothetical protein